MTQNQHDEIQIKKDIEEVQQSLSECDQFMRDSKALRVAMGIDLLSLEINCLLKKLFLCNLHKLGDTQYEWLGEELLKKLNIAHKSVEGRFGQFKKAVQKPSLPDTHNDTVIHNTEKEVPHNG